MPFLYTKNIISNKDKFITFKIKNFKRKKKLWLSMTALRDL